MEEQRTKTLTGVVTSTSGNKSVRVTLDYRIRHPKYDKYVRRKTKLGVHDEHNLCTVGDLVEIAPCRPYSRTKSWRLVRVVQKAVRV